MNTQIVKPKLQISIQRTQFPRRQTPPNSLKPTFTPSPLHRLKVNSSMSPPPQVARTAAGPTNFWGSMPEEEYYRSHGVSNSRSYFQTPNGRIFTQRFLPLDGKVKGAVFMTHGYGSDSGWLFQKICIHYATWGYAVFAADLLGHGRSEGLRCYIDDMDKVAATSLSYFTHVRNSDAHKDQPAFLFGESMGGALTMLMHLQSHPDTWTGLIFSAPLFVLSENTRPNNLLLFGYSLLLGAADTWPVMPASTARVNAVKDPEKLRIVMSNPRAYNGKPRVGSMRELVRVCRYARDHFSSVTAPFLTVHGTEDGVTSSESSRLLYEEAGSEDKSLRLYEGMYHSLVQGEPDENVEVVLKDMREWIDERVERISSKK